MAMASSSSSPAAAAASAGASLPVAVPRTASRRPPPPCWTHDETLALIHSYSRCYLSLRRAAALRAPHWQEISVAVATRCLPSASPKTPIQCRHKVEKLRKRLRSERRRSLSLRPGASPSSSWPYFSLLDSIDPLPAPAPPPDDDGGGGGVAANGGGIGTLRFEIPKAVRSQRTERKKGDVWGEMASALMKLGDGFLRVEQMKMEMAREAERRRMEMQLRRTEMMLDSQRRIVDALVEGMLCEKRAEAYPDS